MEKCIYFLNEWPELVRLGKERAYELFGEKAGMLAEMKMMGLPVPDGFVITANTRRTNLDLLDLRRAVKTLQGKSAKLVARVSIPKNEKRMRASQLNITTLTEIEEFIFQTYSRRNDQDAAILIMSMVDGSMNQNSGCGVLFTRDPATGEKKYMGEYLARSQGDEVLGGMRTPEPVSVLQKTMPKVYGDLSKYTDQLERHFKDALDLEFVVENQKLYLVDIKRANRTGVAAAKIACALVQERICTEEEAAALVTETHMENMMLPQIVNSTGAPVYNAGKGNECGAASGIAVYSMEEANSYIKNGQKVILVTDTLDALPEDKLKQLAGVLTADYSYSIGVFTLKRHKIPAISNCIGLRNCKKPADLYNGIFMGTIPVNGWITIDSQTGKAYPCQLEIQQKVDARVTAEYAKIVRWKSLTPKTHVSVSKSTPTPTPASTSTPTPAPAKQSPKPSSKPVRTTPVAYNGDKPFAFISYAHKDSDVVWPVIQKMLDDGYRVWYDNGIDPGTEWDENIANHVMNCDMFIAFISEHYLSSDNCKDELNFARDENKQRLLVYIDDVQLPGGMRMRLGRLQAIYMNNYPERSEFYKMLYRANGIEVVR